MSDDGRVESWAEAEAWFAVAERDKRAAERCISGDDPLTDVGAYHCQQAAEKIVKGLLVAARIEFRKTHDLDELADLASPFFPTLNQSLDAVRSFTDWGTMFRYPVIDPLAQISPPKDIVAKSVELLKALQRAIATHRATAIQKDAGSKT